MDVSCSKQIPIPFKLYAGTECLLKGTFIKGGKNKTLYQKHILNSKLMKQLLIIFKKLKMTTENEKNYQESQDCWFSMKN